ncbi:MAG: hypothetical protein WEB52_09695 [Dehalococcoidia bacterium]
MRVLMPLVAAISAVAVLFHAGPQQAFACICEEMPHDDARTREVLADDRLDTNFIVARVVEDLTVPGDAAAAVRTQRVYHGGTPPSFEVHLVGCSGGAGPFRAGDEWLLDVWHARGEWRASDCWSGPVQSGRTQRFLASLDRVSPSRPFVWTGEDDGWPMPVAASVAAAVALLTLAGVWRGNRGRPDSER